MNNQAQVYNSLRKYKVSLRFLPSVANQHQNVLVGLHNVCPPGNQCCENLKELTRNSHIFVRYLYYILVIATNSTGVTQRFSANHKISSEQKNLSLFISDKWGSNLTGNWCERWRESGLQCFYLKQSAVYFHHWKDK